MYEPMRSLNITVNSGTMYTLFCSEAPKPCESIKVGANRHKWCRNLDIGFHIQGSTYRVPIYRAPHIGVRNIMGLYGALYVGPLQIGPYTQGLFVQGPYIYGPQIQAPYKQGHISRALHIYIYMYIYKVPIQVPIYMGAYIQGPYIQDCIQGLLGKDATSLPRRRPSVMQNVAKNVLHVAIATKYRGWNFCGDSLQGCSRFHRSPGQSFPCRACASPDPPDRICVGFFGFVILFFGILLWPLEVAHHITNHISRRMHLKSCLGCPWSLGYDHICKTCICGRDRWEL